MGFSMFGFFCGRRIKSRGCNFRRSGIGDDGWGWMVGGLWLGVES